ELRKMFPSLYIGLSISNEAELKNSSMDSIDYVGAGPVYPTDTKADAKNAVGLRWITSLRQTFPQLPLVGIGGIDEQNAKEVIASGADGVAIISAITEARDIQAVVDSL